MEGLRLGHNLGANRLLYKRPSLPVTVMGLEFPNPVGLAAGMDKNGDYVDALGDLGFGHIEAGTVTPRPQPGNPRPRVFRLPAAQAIVNRMGFNNKGIDHLVARVKNRRYSGILGVNIGKNFDTPNEQAVDDYRYCFERAYPVADYIAINISSPNTKGLRDLQATGELNKLLGAIAKQRAQLQKNSGRRVPVAVKLSPDLDLKGLPDIAKAMDVHEIDAVIATNTTIARPGVEGLEHANETGGLSGQPLFEPSNTVLKALRAELPAHIALIGVGGILSGSDAAHKLSLGADLVQVYTGFIYSGPALVGQAVEAMRGQLAE
jgi:dihydroorotate dehydrogenase